MPMPKLLYLDSGNRRSILLTDPVKAKQVKKDSVITGLDMTFKTALGDRVVRFYASSEEEIEKIRNTIYEAINDGVDLDMTKHTTEPTATAHRPAATARDKKPELAHT